MRSLKFGVIIPYFQRKPGLLRGALESIKRQSLLRRPDCTIQIIVVDDASPYPARAEVEGFECTSGMHLRVHVQANGGAGAARNAGLGLIDADCSFVAFLDSDDEWVKHHLESAVAAFNVGADFYFCDAIRHRAQAAENALLPDWFAAGLTAVAGDENLYTYKGDSDLVIVKGIVPTTSTIVHRNRPRLTTFPSRYFRFGEDQYYCLSYFSEPTCIVYSSTPGVRCGIGVNVFSGNEPGSENSRSCLMDEISFRIDALSTLALSTQAAEHVRSRLRRARFQALGQGLWFALDGEWGWLRRSILAHPSVLLALPDVLREMLATRHGRNRGGDLPN